MAQGDRMALILIVEDAPDIADVIADAIVTELLLAPWL